MLGLDPRSIIFLAGFFSLPMSIALLFLRRIYPPSIRGIREWAAGPLACFAATLLFAAYGKIPDFMSIVGGNAMALFGALVLYFGSQRFFGEKPHYRTWICVVLALMLLVASTLQSPSSYVGRLVLVNSLLAVIFLRHAMLLARQHSGNIFTRLTAMTLLTLAVIAVLRAGTTMAGVGITGVFDPKAAQVLYVMGFSMGLLLVSVGTVLMSSERMRAEFEQLATHDPLTGAMSRRAMIAACEQELLRSSRNGQPMTLMMLDLDHFKSVNDTHGHLVGDQVLSDFVGRATSQLRRPDCVGRFGGEEFIVLLPETALEEAVTVAQRVLDMPQNSLGLPNCTVSIGLATLLSEGDTVDVLLARADAALYCAKARGRNRLETTANGQ
jgi:diguanylate cyclase (GGDEF)-like protein